MARGKRWTREEIQQLREMVEQGMSLDAIVRSGRFEGRTVQAIAKQVERLGSIVGQKKKSIVGQISKAEIPDLEEFVSRYVDAFYKICNLTEYDKTDLERFRIIFMAASKYVELYAAYERLRQVEEQMEEIRKRLEALEAQARASAKAG